MNTINPRYWYEKLIRKIYTMFINKDSLTLFNLLCEYDLGHFDQKFINWIKVIKTYPVGSQLYKDTIEMIETDVVSMLNGTKHLHQYNSTDIVHLWTNVACLLAADILQLDTNITYTEWVHQVDNIFVKFTRDQIQKSSDESLLRLIKMLNDSFAYFMRKHYMQYLLIKHFPLLEKPI